MPKWILISLFKNSLQKGSFFIQIIIIYMPEFKNILIEVCSREIEKLTFPRIWTIGPV